MHRVVRSHLKDFSSRYSVQGDEAKQFEAFVNFAAYRSLCAEAIDPSDLIYTEDDPGIDGVMVFLDDVYVSSSEEVADFLAN